MSVIVNRRNDFSNSVQILRVVIPLPDQVGALLLSHESSPCAADFNPPGTNVLYTRTVLKHLTYSHTSNLMLRERGEAL